MSEKSSKILLSIQIILISLLMLALVLYVFTRRPFLILFIVIGVITVLTLFIAGILWKRFKPKKKANTGLFRYYLMMLGVLLGEIALGFLFYLLATASPVIFAVLTLLIFIGLIVFLIYSRYKEKVKIFEKEIVLKQYKKTGLTILFIILGALVLTIIIKAVIILFKAL